MYITMCVQYTVYVIVQCTYIYAYTTLIYNLGYSYYNVFLKHLYINIYNI